MKIVEPFVKEIKIADPYKKMEFAGRLCYKSQDRITENSYERFVSTIVNRGHLSVTEHEKVTFKFNKNIFNKFDSRFISETEVGDYIYATGNIRAWKELLVDKYEDFYFKMNKTYGIFFDKNIGKENSNIEIVDYDYKKLLTFMPENEAKKHVYYTFHLRTDRATTHQLVRHRIASYSQVSQRYVNMDGFEFIVPPQIEASGHGKLYKKTMHHIAKVYGELSNLMIRDKVIDYYQANNIAFPMEEDAVEFFKKNHKAVYGKIEKSVIEDTRYVLPNACGTKIIVTMNARVLLHFFRTRCCSRAQWEIRDMAYEMLRQVQEVCPVVFKSAGPPCIAGPCPEGAMSCGRKASTNNKQNE